jgi:hypothetical protein
MSTTYVPRTQNIDVTCLRVGNYYYPVVQDTGERYIEDGLYYVVKPPRIDSRTGCIVVGVAGKQGSISYQNGAKVAREVIS